ncbi:hypothetical protein [Tunturiibacter lichenicola]|jgi:hypothetical protein|uniref:hypothetical protein n=1 Tax=Tunturiibacter lichenicola TaxID=2051959 RepID=UPI003D9AF908
MDSMPTILPPNEVRSMVVDAIEAKARDLGLTLSQGAKQAILQKTLPNLTRLNKDGELTGQLIDRIQHNSAEFIQILFDQQLHGKASEITIDHVSTLLSSFCQRFPDFIPFCP